LQELNYESDCKEVNYDRDEDEEVIMNLNNINTDDTGDIISFIN
jgi:hypothetical protein